MAEEPANRYALLGDQPSVDGPDPLGFERIAGDLAELVLASRASTPFTLGIDAGWGMGKSTLMQRLRQQLERRTDIETVWFNAWTAEGVSVLEGLIKTVLDKIDPNVLRRQLRNRRLMSWLRMIATLVAGWLRVGALVDAAWRELAVDPRTRNEIRDLMVDTMRDWMGKTGRPGRDRLLVVFVDDLDRSSPENVFQVFEAIKLYLDAPGFVFVIGYDQAVISDAVLEQKKYAKSVRSRDYLEKIVQVGYRIAPPDDKQAHALMERYLVDSGTAALFEDSAKSLVIERNARNPRRIKRFINGFVLEYGLDADWRTLGAVSLIRVLILQIYFPEFMLLFNERAQQDPISEFLEYVKARQALRRRATPADEAGWDAIRTACDSHGLGFTLEDPRDHDAALRALEAELPEGFPKLAQDRDFVTLLESFGTREHWEQVRLKLERRPLLLESTFAAESAPAAAAGATPQPTADQLALDKELPFAGMRMLWIDDHPENNQPYMEELRQAGADVAVASDYEEAERQLTPPGHVHFLISDIARGQQAEAGFTDLRRLRNAGLYDGPAAFFTTRITPTRRRTAAELGALDVATSWGRIRELLTQYWVEKAENVGRARNA